MRNMKHQLLNPDSLHQSAAKALQLSKPKSYRSGTMQSAALLTKSVQDLPDQNVLKQSVRQKPTKHDLFSVFIVFGLPIEEKVNIHMAQIDKILSKNIAKGDQDQFTLQSQLEKVINGPQSSEIKPRILGFVDKNTWQDYQKQDLKYLRQNYPFSAALQKIAIPSGTPSDEKDMSRLKVTTSIDDQDWYKNQLNSYRQFSTYISTDMSAKRDFVQTLRFKRVKCVQVQGDITKQILVTSICSLHVATADSQPLIYTMTNFLNFIFETTFAKQNEREIEKFLEPQQPQDKESIVEKYDGVHEILMKHGPEFICTVMFNHIYLQSNFLQQIQLYFLKAPNIPEMQFRNAYQNSSEYKVEDFNFSQLFAQIDDIDRITLLIRALLLEKKVIFIKDDLKDVAILMQTLMVLLHPFKWSYSLITDLPDNMIEALESPQPFFIAIQKNIWNNYCQVQVMDNVKQENFVLFDLDEKKSRGLTDIYSLDETRAGIPMSNMLKEKYRQLNSLYDQLINQLTSGGDNPENAKQYTREKAEELYCIWFQLKIKQALQNMYLNMIGNIEAGFKSEEVLKELEQKRGGYKNMSGHDIFDSKKYLQILKDEQSEQSEHLQFMTVLVEKQCFVTLIEDMYQSKHEHMTCRCSNCLFYESLKSLAKYTQKPENSFIVFDDSALKKLKQDQNKNADRIYLTYKTSVPVALNQVLDDYSKQLCKEENAALADKGEKMTTNHCRQKVANLIDELKESNDKQNDTNMIEQRLLTQMRGIDYAKIQWHLSKQLEKKKRMNIQMKISQEKRGGAHRDNLSSPNEPRSDSDGRMQFHNFTQMTILNRSTSKLGTHKRINSSNTENATQKSRSLRRENVVSQSYQQPADSSHRVVDQDSFVLQKSPTVKTSFSRNNPNGLRANNTNVLTKRFNKNDMTLSAFTKDKNVQLPLQTQHDKGGNSSLDKNSNCLTPNSQNAKGSDLYYCRNQNFQTASNGSLNLNQFQKKFMSKEMNDNAENLYQKTTNPAKQSDQGNLVPDTLRFQLSRQSNQSSLQNMSKPPNPMISSPYKQQGIQLPKGQAQVPNSSRLKGTMSTLSLGIRSGNGTSDKSPQDQIKSGITFQTHSNENQQELTAKNLASSQEQGRKSAQQLEHRYHSKMKIDQDAKQVQRRAFNQSEQALAVQQPMIIQSPSNPTALQYHTKIAAATTVNTVQNSMFNSRSHSKVHQTNLAITLKIGQNNETGLSKTNGKDGTGLIGHEQIAVKNRTRNKIAAGKVAQTLIKNHKTETLPRGVMTKDNFEKISDAHLKKNIKVSGLKQTFLTTSQLNQQKRKTATGAKTQMSIISTTKVGLRQSNTNALEKTSSRQETKVGADEEVDVEFQLQESVQKVPKSQRFNSFHKKRQLVSRDNLSALGNQNGPAEGRHPMVRTATIQVVQLSESGTKIKQKEQMKKSNTQTSSMIDNNQFGVKVISDVKLQEDKKVRLLLGSPSSRNGGHQRVPSNRYEDQRESILSDQTTKYKAHESLKQNNATNNKGRIVKRSQRYDIQKEYSELMPVTSKDQPRVNTSANFTKSSGFQLSMPVNTKSQVDSKDEDIIETNRGEFDTAKTRLDESKPNLKSIIQSHTSRKVQQLSSPKQSPPMVTVAKLSAGESSSKALTSSAQNMTINHSLSTKLPQDFIKSKSTVIDDNTLIQSGLSSNKQTVSFHTKEQAPTKEEQTGSAKQLFSPAHLNVNLSIPSLRMTIDRPSIGGESSTNKINRVSITSNQKQNKKKMIEKVKNVKGNFKLNPGNLGGMLTNKLSARLAKKKDEVEETVENSEEPKSGVHPHLLISSQPSSAKKQLTVYEGTGSDLDEDAADEQHPYQLDHQVVFQKVPSTHKKSKSIFTSENLVVSQQMTSESPSKIPCETNQQISASHMKHINPNSMDPSGEYRIDFQRMQQQHQLKVSSHGGDIDREPWTPSSKNQSSGKTSMYKSKSNQQKSGSDKKGPPSSKEESLHGSSGRQGQAQKYLKQKILHQKLSSSNNEY